MEAVRPAGWGHPAVAWAAVAVLAGRSVWSTAILIGDARGEHPVSALMPVYQPTAALLLAALVWWAISVPGQRRRLLAWTAVCVALADLVLGVAVLTQAENAPSPSWAEPATAALAVMAALHLVAVALLLLGAWATRASRTAAPVATTGRDRTDTDTDANDPAAEQRGQDRAPTDQRPPGAAPAEDTPVWDADHAVGAAWLSAEAAARGSAGQSEPASASGWVPLGESPRELPSGHGDAPNRTG